MARGVEDDPDDLKHYFAEARSWDHDRMVAAIRSKRLAWLVAAASAGLAALGLVSVALLTPLKSVVPYVITVDRATGASELTSRLNGDNRILYSDAVRKYFLSTYVRFREGWIPQARKEYFETVLNLSGREEQARWTAFYDKDNPDSPQMIFNDLDTIFVAIRSVSFIGEKTAQIRFRKIHQRGSTITETPAIATVTFEVSDTPLSEALRLLNPLGFQVKSYRADTEVMPEVTPS